MATKRRPRRPVEDSAACTVKILEILKQNRGEQVTAGWIWDRGIGFKLCTIEVCLRDLLKLKQVSRIVHYTGGFQYWVWPALPPGTPTTPKADPGWDED